MGETEISLALSVCLYLLSFCTEKVSQNIAGSNVFFTC